MENTIVKNNSSLLLSMHQEFDHWTNDLEFYELEISFLFRLVDRYFIWLLNETKIMQAQNLVSRIHQVDSERQAITDALKKNLALIESRIDDGGIMGEQSLIEAQMDFRKRYTDFVHSFRALKASVFSLSESMIESEKLGRILRG